MSAAATPVPPHRFAEAIAELPLANLHFKAAELRNSIHHLTSSNQQLKHFADDGDQDCADAMLENEVVIERMEERIKLLKVEVERRGFLWSDHDETKSLNGDMEINESDGNIERTAGSTVAGGSNPQGRTTSRAGQLLSDEELAQRLSERMENETGGYDGVHL